MANPNLPDIYSAKPELPKEKKIEPVVSSSDYVIRKKPLGRRMRDILLSGDVNDVKSFLIEDVLIPSVKETIFDLVEKGMHMLLFNNTGRVSDVKKNQTYISYNNYSNKDRRSVSNVSPNRREIRELDDIIFYDRGKAQLVLEKIFALYEDYHVVSKADVFQIIKDEDENFKYDDRFTDHNWGWDDLSGAHIERVRGGYLLCMPKMTAIN